MCLGRELQPYLWALTAHTGSSPLPGPPNPGAEEGSSSAGPQSPPLDPLTARNQWVTGSPKSWAERPHLQTYQLWVLHHSGPRHGGKPLCSLMCPPGPTPPARSLPLQRPRHQAREDTQLTVEPLRKILICVLNVPFSPPTRSGVDPELRGPSCGHTGRAFSRAWEEVSSHSHRILDI